MQNKTAPRQLQVPVSSEVTLYIVIPYRNPELTRGALKYASTFAGGLNAKLRLIDVHVVPYGVPLDKPTVNPKHLNPQTPQLAEESTVPVSAEVVYARDWEQGLRGVWGRRFPCAHRDPEMLVADQREAIGGKAEKSGPSSHVGGVRVRIQS